MKTIEEAWAALEREKAECWHELHGAEGRDHVASCARVLALATLEAATALEQYTCHVACDHGEECRTTRRAALRAQIEKLGE
jgi:hypothetical protein